MANTLLTPTMITREAQMVLHQKLFSSKFVCCVWAKQAMSSCCCLP